MGQPRDLTDPVGRTHDNAPGFPAELAARIVRMLTDSGQLVLDPFVGTGTATAIAHLLERRWIGIDNNADIAAAALDHTLMQRPAGGASAADAGAAGAPVH